MRLSSGLQLITGAGYTLFLSCETALVFRSFGVGPEFNSHTFHLASIWYFPPKMSFIYIFIIFDFDYNVYTKYMATQCMFLSCQHRLPFHRLMDWAMFHQEEEQDRHRNIPYALGILADWFIMDRFINL